MDRILSELFGGGEPEATRTVDDTDAAERAARHEARQRRRDESDTQRRRREFVDHYTAGDPTEGFTTEEAVAHLRELRDELSPAEFRRAMERTVEHLPPSQRDDFIAIMREYSTGAAQSAGSGSGSAGGTAPSGAPLGGIMAGLIGSGTGGVDLGDLFDDLTRGGLRAPDTAPGAPPTEADFQALLNSPLARAVLGGVAAYGLQGMDEERQGEAPDKPRPEE